ncbi:MULTISPECIES: hypothetical protein [unclassified Mycobacterium]|uniref:Rv2732c family membrane protein n=1 Tax=unclassified Mycobacterium TaxID=2642494 RepID=UPI0004038E4F|nr:MULTISPECIES: hypothetical protein [unclassified Mycobacterium]
MRGNRDNQHNFEAYRADIEAAERRVAGEIDPGGRGLVVAICVFVLLGSFLLPHTGSVRGWDVLFPGQGTDEALVTLPSQLFMWLALVFGVGFSLLALVTRRWTVAWVALAGSAVASAAGLLAVWSRQTAVPGDPGPGIGLILAWITLIVLTFHWARVVWSRTALQLAAEAQRRQSTAQLQSRNLLDDLSRPEDPPPSE